MVSGLLSYQGLRNGPQVTFQRTLKGPLGSQSLSVDRGKVRSILRGLHGEEKWRGISRREQSIKDGGGGGESGKLTANERGEDDWNKTEP